MQWYWPKVIVSSSIKVPQGIQTWLERLKYHDSQNVFTCTIGIIFQWYFQIWVLHNPSWEGTGPENDHQGPQRLQYLLWKHICQSHRSRGLWRSKFYKRLHGRKRTILPNNWTDECWNRHLQAWFLHDRIQIRGKIYTRKLWLPLEGKIISAVYKQMFFSNNIFQVWPLNTYRILDCLR